MSFVQYFIIIKYKKSKGRDEEREGVYIDK